MRLKVKNIVFDPPKAVIAGIGKVWKRQAYPDQERYQVDGNVREIKLMY